MELRLALLLSEWSWRLVDNMGYSERVEWWRKRQWCDMGHLWTFSILRKL